MIGNRVVVAIYAFQQADGEQPAELVGLDHRDGSQEGAGHLGDGMVVRDDEAGLIAQVTRQAVQEIDRGVQ